MKKEKMSPEKFVKLYEKALGTQNWKSVNSFFSETACVTFSDGTIHLGINEIQKAFVNNFSRIKNESYKIENIVWLKQEPNFAVYVFEFNWSGKINEELISGSGIGTSCIIKDNEDWKILSEHLGRRPK